MRPTQMLRSGGGSTPLGKYGQYVTSALEQGLRCFGMPALCPTQAGISSCSMSEVVNRSSFY